MRVVRELSNYIMLYTLRAVGVLPCPQRWMYHAVYFLYYIAVLIKKTRILNRLVFAHIRHAFPEWSEARCWRTYTLFWKSQIYATVYESPIMNRRRYVNLAQRADPRSRHKEQWFIWSGLEHIKATEDDPVIFSLVHMHSLEIAVIATSRQRPIHYLPKDPKVKLFARKVQENRSALDRGVRIDHNNMLGMRRCLDRRGAIVFLGDQYVRPKSPVRVNFFNTMIEVQPSISRLAVPANAKVIPVYIRRNQDLHYELTYQPPLELSATDHQHNTQLVFSHYERCIRRAPEQYIWNHNRFFR